MTVKYPCPTCKHVFKQQAHLQKHLDRKTKCISPDEATERFRCVCGKSYAQSAGLSRHRGGCLTYERSLNGQLQPDNSTEGEAGPSESGTLSEDRQGLVYIVTAECIPFVKIGRTTASIPSLRSRYKCNYGTIQLYCWLVRDNFRVEDEMKDLFVEHHMSGELYNKTESQTLKTYVMMLTDLICKFE